MRRKGRQEILTSSDKSAISGMSIPSVYVAPLLTLVPRVFDRFKALGYKEQGITEVLKDVPMPPTLLTEQGNPSTF